MSKLVYFSEWASYVRMARAMRAASPANPGPYEFDPAPPPRLAPEDVEFCLKLVAHWEGGPHPDDPAAAPVEPRLPPGGR